MPGSKSASLAVSTPGQKTLRRRREEATRTPKAKRAAARIDLDRAEAPDGKKRLPNVNRVLFTTPPVVTVEAVTAGSADRDDGDLTVSADGVVRRIGGVLGTAFRGF